MGNQNQVNYFRELVSRIKIVFDKYPFLNNHFAKYPWLEGALGDPFSGIMFIGENPSLRQVKKAQNKRGTTATPDAQWNTSKGDQIFREALFVHGFKLTPPDIPGGWNCYITNVIKEADYAKRTGAKTQNDRNQMALLWFEVLEWELVTCKPKLIVTMGDQTKLLLEHLYYKFKRILPLTMNITHYSYIGQRYDTVQNLKAGDPKRIEQYRSKIAYIKQVFEDLKNQ